MNLRKSTASVRPWAGDAGFRKGSRLVDINGPLPVLGPLHGLHEARTKHRCGHREDGHSHDGYKSGNDLPNWSEVGEWELQTGHVVTRLGCCTQAVQSRRIRLASSTGVHTSPVSMRRVGNKDPGID